jgi:hypothetical protein
MVLIFIPLMLAVFGGDRFRYPCQDPTNWGSEQCSKPLCEINRQCPEHIFDQDASMLDALERQISPGANKK